MGHWLNRLVWAILIGMVWAIFSWPDPQADLSAPRTRAGHPFQCHACRVSEEFDLRSLASVEE